MELLATMVLEDERPWASSAAPYQWDDARSILEPEDDVRQVFITRPRGGRKTTDLGAIVLAVLARQAPAHARCYVGASDEDQAQELIDAAEGIVKRTPGLSAVFKVTGLRITYLPSGSSVEALPADSSAMGKRPFFIVIDELANWPDTRKHRGFWDVMTSAARKVPGCRLVAITNSGSPDHWSWQRREVARSSRHWLLREVPGPLPWLTVADLEALRENVTIPSEFDRLHLNRWTTAEDRLTTRADVEACVLHAGPLQPQHGIRYAAGLDVGVKNDRTALVVAHSDVVAGQRRVVVDLIRVWTPAKGRPVDLQQVEQTVADVCGLYDASLLFDPSQALLMGQRLRERGVKAVEEAFTVASNSLRAGLMFRLLKERALDLPDDEELVDELAMVRLVEGASGRYRLDHDSGRHDDRVQALALAAQHLLDQAARPRRRLRFRDGSSTPAEMRPVTSRQEQRDQAWAAYLQQEAARDPRVAAYRQAIEGQS